MSDFIGHECGVCALRLLKPLEYYKHKYGSFTYGIDKMHLMMEKQKNRGQDGAGFASIKLDTQPGERYISRARSKSKHTAIETLFDKIKTDIETSFEVFPESKKDIATLKKHIPYIGEALLGHVRYGTSGGNNKENIHPFLRQNNWMHRNLIVAGNFNMTNLQDQFQALINLGQHPKEKVDTVTVMEKIGHFLDDAVNKIYKDLKAEGYSKREASPLIAERLHIHKILKRSSKDWDGGYVIAGLLGHGDMFVLRDPIGIRPAYYYHDEEVVVIASERAPIQTVFNAPFETICELPPGKVFIVKKTGDIFQKKVLKRGENKACSFERIYFSRANDTEIYRERKKLGQLQTHEVLKAVDSDLENTVFSFIPNTSETYFYGLLEGLQNHLADSQKEEILKLKIPDEKALNTIFSRRIRIEKVPIKEAKVRTFISEDLDRDFMVTNSYDITYGTVKPTDNLVVFDDSIVRGTTLKKNILRMLDRLNPKKIVIVSGAPQIRYPDCYGIDMAKLKDLVAFTATIELHKERGNYTTLKEEIYQDCLSQPDSGEVKNCVKALYEGVSDEDISDKVSEILSKEHIKADVKVIFQSVRNLHKACPKNKGDWYFTGNYPTNGGNKIANKAFVNYYKGFDLRAE
ncbi:amidophosphoribosyltransferase [Elysia marginata]|uniref:Amidophosphoribosyltransferase n=1 Tax=Elysia marginata TaxID=1093978 RepID=A0AAV4FXV0_9GAST|nr:amidophosphoribosyltransferase [Elysia marginata]